MTVSSTESQTTQEKLLCELLELLKGSAAAALGQPFLTIAQAARLLQTAESHVRALIRTGRLPAVDLSTSSADAGARHRPVWRIRREDLDALLAARQPALPPPSCHYPKVKT